MEILAPPREVQNSEQIDNSTFPFSLKPQHSLVSPESAQSVPSQLPLPGFTADTREFTEDLQEISIQEKSFGIGQVMCKEASWQVPLDITHLEKRALMLASGISTTLADLHAGNPTEEGAKLRRFYSFKVLVRDIPAYTLERADDGREAKVVNRAINLLTTIYSDYVTMAKNEPQIEEYLDNERNVFDERWKKWFGSYDINPDTGEKEFTRGKQYDFYKSMLGKNDDEFCGKIQDLEMEARRKYLFGPNND